MNRYKILLFDLDDTLINNRENVRYAFQKVVEEQGEEYTENDFKKWYNVDIQFWKDWQGGLIALPEHLKHEEGKKSDEFLSWLRAQRFLIYYQHRISLERAIELNRIYMDALQENVIPIDGAYETLKYLSTKQYYIVIVTNGPRTATRSKLTKIDCIDFVNEILSADMFGYMKPHIEFFKGIEKTLDNYNHSEYLIIGDSLKSDVGFAMNCNLDSCWFNGENKELKEEYKPTMIIQDLRELKDLL